MNNNKELDMDEFIIRYDYFGLSSSAEVQKRKWRSESYYRCFLDPSRREIDIRQIEVLNGNYWIDMSVEHPTPLSQILGQAIENKLGS
jgi:hypothetical protein